MPSAIEPGLFPAFDACPACLGPVRAVCEADLTLFVCTTCGASWHVEMGVVYRIDGPPSGAPGASETEGSRTPR